MACLIVPAVSVAQGDEDVISQEYFLQQPADEDLVIRINAFEAEFESTISGENGEILLVSAVPGSRIVPIIQYVDAPDRLRQLDIRVNSRMHTDRSEFGLELTRLKIWDDRSRSISQAYRMLSFGMLSSPDDSAANWTVRIDSLVNAGRLFQRFGMMEMRLWANYMSAHLILFHLHDYSIVYSMTNEILADLRSQRLQEIELATLQLQSAALIQLRRKGSLGTPADGSDPVQTSLARTAALAREMGFGFEQAQALNLSGIEYASESQYRQALQQFEQAVAIAESVGDAELANSTRERIVEIHSIEGDTVASSEVLQKIGDRLQEEGAGDELALNLLAQARVAIRSFEYGRALELLSQALGHENNSAIRRQINFEQARVFYETGRLDEALDFMNLAQVNAQTGQQGRTNALIDIGEGLRILANIHRARGDYAAMRRARSAQGQSRPARAQFLYDQGLDEVVATGRNSQRARSLFRQSYQSADSAAQPDLRHLSRLQLCVSGGSADALCSGPDIRSSYEWLRNGGVPRIAVEAMYLRVRLLVLSGQREEAIDLVDELVDEIHMLRYALPGVLGSWYRERHDALFEYCLGLLATQPAKRKRMDGLASLLVLSKIRHIEKHAGSHHVAAASLGNTTPLRARLAQRQHAEAGESLSALNDQINQGLGVLRERFARKFEYLSEDGVKDYLEGLGRNEVLLTYHISPDTAQVWIGQKDGVQRRSISSPAYIYSALQEFRQDSADVGEIAFNNKMDALGRRLISPIAGHLAETIYWIPSGPLLGFPFDALRTDDRYLVEDHVVVSPLSFPAKANPHEALQTGFPETVFLAGHPQDYSGDYATRLETSVEIRTVADVFIGPGLSIVQGAALLPDEFETEQFRQAQLAHLSMPGVIDLKYPDQSSLELSGAEFSGGRVLLMPADIQAGHLEAELVFLSATRLRGLTLSGFSSQPGLISDFIDGGADSVIARSWPGRGSIGEAFIGDFYRGLEESGNAAASLAGAKREYLRVNRGTGLYDWAGYQLYTQ